MAYTDQSVKTFVASAALGQFLRVTYGSSGTAGQMILAGAAVAELGVTDLPSYAALDDIPVRLRTAQGTQQFVASGAIALGATVRCAAGGKITSSGTDPIIGTALEAATADGDIIEVLRTN